MKQNMVQLRIHYVCTELHEMKETLFQNFHVIINEENSRIVQEQGKKPVLILSDKFCDEQSFPYLFPKGKFGKKTSQDIPISPAWYFNKRLLSFNEHFASEADYIFLPGLRLSSTT